MDIEETAAWIQREIERAKKEKKNKWQDPAVWYKMQGRIEVLTELWEAL